LNQQSLTFISYGGEIGGNVTSSNQLVFRRALQLGYTYPLYTVEFSVLGTYAVADPPASQEGTSTSGIINTSGSPIIATVTTVGSNIQQKLVRSLVGNVC
jgi:hypothetical protein